MAQYTFQLRGWPAVIALAALAAITSIAIYSRVRPVDDAMRAALSTELMEEYSGRSAQDLARLVAESREGSLVESLPPLVQRQIEFASVAAHGGSAVVVRAEINVDGGPPPDGRVVRYFRMAPRFGEAGWLVLGESDAYAYYEALLPANRSSSHRY